MTPLITVRPPRHFSALASLFLIGLLPFALFSQYVTGDVSIGNDFQEFYAWKPYLLSMLEHGIFPLWSPTEGCGYPFFSDPWAQAFYPFNLIYYLYYLLFQHFSVWDYEQFTFLAISAFGVGIFAWLRSLNISRLSALAATLCAEMSLKVTELVRFPNAANAAIWLPWLLLGVTLAADKKRKVRGAVVIAVAYTMLLTAGYPYFIIYAFLLVVPYGILFLAARTRNAFHQEGRATFSGTPAFLVSTTVPVLVTSLFCAPLFSNTVFLLKQTVDRGTPDLAFAAFLSQ